MGRVDVDAMLDEMSPSQFNEWLAAYEAEGMRHEWERHSDLAAVIVNTVNQALSTEPLKKEHIVKRESFMPYAKPEEPTFTVDDAHAQLRGLG